MTNPFAGVGVPDGNSEIQGLVDQAVILQSALVPKLPEINITDGMIPIIDQVYPDSGSQSKFTPGTTINFNFGNSHGKLVDWTQSRLRYTVNVEVTVTKTVAGTKEGNTHLDLGTAGIVVCLRHAAMVFSQVTFGGAGRPITINDFEMVALARSLLTTAESNVQSHIGDMCTHDHIGCGTTLSDLTVGDATKVGSCTLTLPIRCSIPLTTVMPMFGTVDNYLLSTTSGIELRLTVTTNKNVLCFTSPNPWSAQVKTKTGWLWTEKTRTTIQNNPCYGKFHAGAIDFTDTDGVKALSQAAHSTTAYDGQFRLEISQLLDITDVCIDLISTQHPDDYIVNMMNNICSTRGLFYPNQMFIATPFQCNFKQSSQTATSHAFLVPVVSGYRNIDAVFCWFTEQNNPNALVKLPITNIYTSLNGTFKMPVHGYHDHTYDTMVETAAQFNRCFGTINSTLLSPMQDIMDCYLPDPYQQAKATNKLNKAEVTKQRMCEAMEFEQNNCDSFIASATMWELEKSSWMNGPDFSQHSNKYQIVFELEHVPQEANYTFWVVQRFDAYTHVYNGYVNLLTTKEEVAMALAQAQAGQAVTH